MTTAFRLISSLLLLLTMARFVSGQSADPNYPTPVHDKNLIGHITARDLGDARLTNHFYAFRGTPGDLVITVQSRNLNGDIDVFTAGTLRPLLKLTLYAEGTAPVTKGIYLRTTADLVLRVQARTPNDEEGTYQLFFSGSFQAIEGTGIAETETPGAASTGVASSSRPGRRASSVGARIDEPPPPLSDVAVVPALPEPTPAPTPVESPKPAVTETATPAEPAPARPAPRTARNRPPTSRTPRRTTTTTPAPKPEETPVETPKTEEPTTPEPEPKPKPPARTTSRRAANTAARRSAEPKPEPATETKPEAEMGPRLVIETNDGTLINRSMSGVKRVSVENGVVLVIAKDGKIDRILLANVVKMSIQ